MGLTSVVKHTIAVKPGTKPIKQAPRHLGMKKEAGVDRQIQKLASQSIIELASGAWSPSVVLVKIAESFVLTIGALTSSLCVMHIRFLALMRTWRR